MMIVMREDYVIMTMMTMRKTKHDVIKHTLLRYCNADVGVMEESECDTKSPVLRMKSRGPIYVIIITSS